MADPIEHGETEEARMRRPDPDPTRASIELVSTSIASVKELMATRDEVTRARLDAMDKAVQIVAAFPTAIDVAVGALKQLHEEKFQAADRERHLLVSAVNERIAKTEEVSEQKFARIDGGFVERDKRTDQLSLANATAIAAALQANKERQDDRQNSSTLAIDKSEKAAIESVKQLQTLFQTAIAAQTDQINDLKSRLDKGEGKSSVGDPATALALRDMASAVSHLNAGSNQSAGAAKANADYTGWIIAGMVMLAAVALVFVDLLKK